MRVTLFSGGSRGDVEPYLALAEELRRRDHSVRFACNPEHAERAASAGFEFMPLASPRVLAAAAEDAGLNRPGVPLAGWLGRLRRVLAGSNEWLRALLEDSAAASQGAEALVASPMGLAAPHLAERQQIPCAWALLQPLQPTREFPIFLAARWLRGPGLVNLASYHVAAALAWRYFGRRIQRWRVEHLGLPPLSSWQVRKGWWHGQRPVIYGFSEALIQRSSRWPESAVATGYWQAPSAAGELEPKLERFLKAGAPPIYVALGSIHGGEDPALSRHLATALQRCRRRAVVQEPWGGLPEALRIPEVMPVHEVDYQQLLPRVHGVIHHGGAGTSAAVLRAGQPSICLPQLVDQWFWAQRLASLGVAPAPWPAKRATAERLAVAIEAMSEPNLRARAERLGAVLRAEDGVVVAADHLEENWRINSSKFR